MTRDDALQYMNEHPEIWLKPAKRVSGKLTYVCPICGNGSGSNGTGITENPKSPGHYTCFKCSTYGDMVDFIAYANNLKPGSKEAFDKAREIYGVLDDIEYIPLTRTKEKPVSKSDQEIKDFLAKSMADREKAFAYLESRGISRDTADRLGFGYDSEKEAVVIPSEAYTGGLTAEERYIKPGQMRYSKLKGSKAGLFNPQALRDASRPIFVTEGAIDASSIEEAGFSAVALNSSDNWAKFLDYVKALRINHSFILALDNDQTGRETTEKLKAGLESLSLKVFVYSVPEGESIKLKDPNDLLLHDREHFRESLQKAMLEAQDETAKGILEHNALNMLPGFRDYLKQTRDIEPIKTGFSKFDEAIGGGLYPKLYIVGAVPSLGKTTLVLQMADHIAGQGTDVLIFTQEMPKEDLISRSVSRITYDLSIEQRNRNIAKTELDIGSGWRYKRYSQDDIFAIEQAFDRYEGIAKNLYIYEGRKTAKEISQTVAKHISFTGKKPVVVIDYLQIIVPEDNRIDPRLQIDNNITAITEMRSFYRVPVMLISSFSRSAYAQADGASFKGSGEIEYNCDCGFILEYNVPKREDLPRDKDSKTKDEMIRDALKEAPAKNPREIVLTFTKNRGNRNGVKINLLYNAMYNHFEETERFIARQ